MFVLPMSEPMNHDERADDMNFGERVKALREARGWSQEELGERAGGYKKSYISRIENSVRPKSRQVQSALAEAFGITEHLLIHPTAPIDRLADISELLEQIVTLEPEQINVVSQLIRTLRGDAD